MSDGTTIEWTDATWNPITGCSVVSPGCTNCYAMKLAGTRLKHHESRSGLTKESKSGPVWTGEVRFNEQWLEQPLRWTKPRMIFVCAHGDLFAEGVPDEWIDQVFAVMALAPQHTFQVLTKRPERMREYLTAASRQSDIAAAGVCIGQSPSHQFLMRSESWPLPNVWLGVSVEDQKRADERIPILLDTPAAIRWISAEPLLGPVDISRWTASAKVTCKKCSHDFWLHDANPCQHEDYGGGWTLACPICGGCRCKRAWTAADERTVAFEPPQDWIDRKVGRFDKVHPTIEIKSLIDWVVAGGESGPGARPMHPDWARSLRDQCKAAAVPFLFKQWGEWWEVGSEMRDENGKHLVVDADSHEASELWDEHFDCLITHDGRRFTPETLPEDTLGRLMSRIGKRAAGRLLDGIEHDAFPVTGR
ncbi:phage Gp37/Gp68 family protein [Rhizobium daejeonense]|uniref:Phage Gp37/Gp68 family protein n=1 Tax=Rhizobium daejeonense TaxID=240521 RepID=A0A6M1RZT3_9HYPH|nr:phage Gp37/Gp68 family protein [Rhizobium daejeonense]NGO64243.1 phage Gp37/Gp68 family protein [Rhizobium daejeonense]